MEIRPATREDDDAVWSVLGAVIRAGETYALPRDMDRQAALDWFFAPGQRTLVAEDRGEVLGVCFWRANSRGGGAHVANAAYATAAAARGRGVATALCERTLAEARAAGFRAMQFNFVVATNPALGLWQRLGFAIVGTLPGAFEHPTLGEVDAHVMYRRL
jgi:L-amino acid N-acyltransferase YncA